MDELDRMREEKLKSMDWKSALKYFLSGLLEFLEVSVTDSPGELKKGPIKLNGAVTICSHALRIAAVRGKLISTPGYAELREFVQATIIEMQEAGKLGGKTPASLTPTVSGYEAPPEVHKAKK